MPRWFWSSAPHLESTCPVFLKNSLHINVNNLAAGGDDGFTPQAASARVHSLDSNYTTDVLRYALFLVNFSFKSFFQGSKGIRQRTVI